jgi:hypothetical protein
MPDDPDIEYMDPVMKAWMFYSWIEDYNDEFKLLENQGYLIGSFINPEAVKRMMGSETHASDDTEFEETLKQIREGSKKEQEKLANAPKRRRKRKIQG